MKYTTACFLAASLLASAVGAPAQATDHGLLTERMLPLSLEIEAARSAIQACAARHYQISVVIVDAYGNTRLLMVSDDAIFTTASSARRKAYTSVMMRTSTADLQRMIAAHPEAPRPGDGDPQMLFLAGGIPIRAGSEVIGGIGVGGSPSQIDAVCAQAGIDRISSSLESP